MKATEGLLIVILAILTHYALEALECLIIQACERKRSEKSSRGGK